MTKTLEAVRVRSTDTAFGMLGASLVACAFVFAVFGTPPLPPAPMVLLGIPSPLTGMTRSFVALASADVGRAFVLHPLGPLCFAACVLATVSSVLTLRTGRRPAFVQRILTLRFAVPAVVAVFMAVWIRQIVTFS